MRAVRVVTCSWERGDQPYESLPRLPLFDVREMCLADWRGWICTRRAEHTGRHAAIVVGRVVAVWSTKPCPRCGSEVTS